MYLPKPSLREVPGVSLLPALLSLKFTCLELHVVEGQLVPVLHNNKDTYSLRVKGCRGLGLRVA